MRRVAVSVWELWERIFHRLNGSIWVGDPAESPFLVSKVRYRGQPLTYSDGTRLLPGQVGLEVHFANRHLGELAQGGLGGLKALRRAEAYLPELARMVATDPRLQGIEMLFGTTVLNRVVGRLGFEVAELPSRWRKFWAGLYLKILLVLYHPKGLMRLYQHGDALVPRTVFISRRALLSRYWHEEHHRH